MRYPPGLAEHHLGDLDPVLKAGAATSRSQLKMFRTRSPLKGSFKGDVDIAIDIDMAVSINWAFLKTGLGLLERALGSI